MKTIAWVYLLVSMSACLSVPKNLVEPKVNLQAVDVKDATFSDATLLFQFQVENPNAVPIEVDSLNYNLKLNGQNFTEGSVNEGLKVGANSQTTIPLPIRVKYTDLTSSLSQLISRGSTPYELNGSVKMGLFSIPFKKEGEVRLQQ